MRSMCVVIACVVVGCSEDEPHQPTRSTPVYTERIEQVLPLKFADDVGDEWVAFEISIPSVEALDLPEFDAWGWGSKQHDPSIQVASDTSGLRAFTLSVCDSAPWTYVVAKFDLHDGQVAVCKHTGPGWDNPDQYFVHRVINLGIHHVWCDFRVDWSPRQPIVESLQAGISVCESLHIFGVPRGRPQPLY